MKRKRKSGKRRPRSENENRVMILITTSISDIGDYSWSVSSVSDILSIPQSSVSVIMTDLRIAGLIESVKAEGRKHYYRAVETI